MEIRRLIDDIQNAYAFCIQAIIQSNSRETTSNEHQQGTDQSTPSSQTQNHAERNKTIAAVTADTNHPHSSSNNGKTMLSTVVLPANQLMPAMSKPMNSTGGGTWRWISVPVGLAEVDSEWDIPPLDFSVTLPNRVHEDSAPYAHRHSI